MIDLHMHSHYSDDGEFAPGQLMEQCAAQGITLMAITDHNGVKANPEAAAAAQKHGITYIPGIEIDCVFGDGNFHLLGYGIDSASRDFQFIQANIEEQEYSYSIQALEATQSLGFDISERDMWALSGTTEHKLKWTGEMFAEVLLHMPAYAEHPLLAPYRAGGARSDNPYVNFYWDYYAQGKPCYVPMVFPSMARCVEIIHYNGGLAVLAHPAVNLKGRERLLDGILRLDLDGIEAYCSYHTPDQAAYYQAVAEKHNLLLTCGSDFHGKTKPAVSLGGFTFPKSEGREHREKRIAEELLSRLSAR